jgi:YD repeat-containing protein
MSFPGRFLGRLSLMASGLFRGRLFLGAGFEARNQLIKATERNTVSIYEYNAEGYRVEKTVDGVLTRYLYEKDKVTLEVDVSGNQTARNIYGVNLISRTVSSLTLYYMYNGHADVTTLISSSGDVISTYYYDAFGNILEETGAADNPYRYSGYQYDTETDLYYLNAR